MAGSNPEASFRSRASGSQCTMGIEDIRPGPRMGGAGLGLHCVHLHGEEEPCGGACRHGSEKAARHVRSRSRESLPGSLCSVTDRPHRAPPSPPPRHCALGGWRSSTGPGALSEPPRTQGGGSAGHLVVRYTVGSGEAPAVPRELPLPSGPSLHGGPWAEPFLLHWLEYLL